MADEEIQLDPSDRGVLVTAGDNDDEVIGTDGDVTWDDSYLSGVHGPPGLWEVDSGLEQLIVDLAAALGIWQSNLANLLGNSGILASIDPNGGYFGNGAPGIFYIPTGLVEIDNGRMVVGDVVDIGGGDDKFEGGGGNDIALGGTGDDDIEGGAGDDVLFGQDGEDDIEGGDGDDLLIGGAGADDIEGGDGIDTVS